MSDDKPKLPRLTEDQRLEYGRLAEKLNRETPATADMMTAHEIRRAIQDLVRSINFADPIPDQQRTLLRLWCNNLARRLRRDGQTIRTPPSDPIDIIDWLSETEYPEQQKSAASFPAQKAASEMTPGTTKQEDIISKARKVDAALADAYTRSIFGDQMRFFCDWCVQWSRETKKCRGLYAKADGEIFDIDGKDGDPDKATKKRKRRLRDRLKTYEPRPSPWEQVRSVPQSGWEDCTNDLASRLLPARLQTPTDESHSLCLQYVRLAILRDMALREDATICPITYGVLDSGEVEVTYDDMNAGWRKGWSGATDAAITAVEMDLRNRTRPEQADELPADRRTTALPPVSVQMDEMEVRQIREYADRVAGLLEPTPMPPFEPTWESAPPGLDHTNRVAQRIADERNRILHPLKVEYREKIVAVLDDGWEPIADVFEHHAPQTLARLGGWRQDILDHTDPTRDPHMYWLESRDGKFGPNLDLKDRIGKLESKLRREAQRAETALNHVKDDLQDEETSQRSNASKIVRQARQPSSGEVSVILEKLEELRAQKTALAEKQFLTPVQRRVLGRGPDPMWLHVWRLSEEEKQEHFHAYNIPLHYKPSPNGRFVLTKEDKLELYTEDNHQQPIHQGRRMDLDEDFIGLCLRDRLKKAREDYWRESVEPIIRELRRLLFPYWQYLSVNGTWGELERNRIDAALASKKAIDLDEVIQEIERFHYLAEVEERVAQDRQRDTAHVDKPDLPDGFRQAEKAAQNPPTHSADFHSVRWYGQICTFTNQQAAVVKLLWQAWENGTPDLGQDYLLTESESDTDRLRNIFKQKDGMHPAWGTMIVESKKGVYRLREPDENSRPFLKTP